LIKSEQTAVARVRTEKMYIGIGACNSATSGAIVIDNRAAKLTMPIDVTANRVGNILACAMYTILKLAEMPSLARMTRIVKDQPTSAS